VYPGNKETTNVEMRLAKKNPREKEECPIKNKNASHDDES
jgi:hypothetical protein